MPPDNNIPRPSAPIRPPNLPAKNGPSDFSSEQLLHEINGILDGSLRNISLVMSTLRDTAQAGRPVETDHIADLSTRLDTASQGLRQMAAMLHHHLDLSHQPDRLTSPPQTLTQVIEQVVSLFTPAADELEIEILVRVSPDAALLPGEPIYPLLVNALRNSIQAIRSDRGSRVELSAQLHDNNLRLAILDDGPGIDPRLLDDQKKFIFGKTTKSRGRGLGLALCREIAHQLHGTLELANRPQGGTILTLCYPLTANPKTNGPVRATIGS